MPSPTSDVCLVTVATEAFVPGTRVLLGSFLKQHPRFAGDCVVLHDGLSQTAQDVLAAASDRVRFEPVSTALKERLAHLRATHPAFARGLGYLYSLEAFRLRGYRKVLFYDSDVLVRAPVDEMFEADDLLLCCPDHVTLAGGRRDARTFEPLPVADPASVPTLAATFNSGFLLFDGRLADGACYADLLAMVVPETWPGPDAPHRDQFLLNRYFAGRHTLVSSTYNYLLASTAAIRAREHLLPERAKVVHFNQPVKPWTSNAMLRWTWANPTYAPTRYFALWSAARGHAADVRRAAHAADARQRRRARSGYGSDDPSVRRLSEQLRLHVPGPRAGDLPSGVEPPQRGQAHAGLRRAGHLSLARPRRAQARLDLGRPAVLDR